MKPIDSLGQYQEGTHIFEEGLISTQENHEGLSYISPQKDVIIFTRSDKNYEQSGLYISRFLEGQWTVPTKIKLTESSYEAGIAFSPDKSKAFFTNKFKLKEGDSTNLWNIWEIELDEKYEFKKETAKPLVSPINSKYQDCCLTMNSNGNVYFSSNRDGTWDIYSAQYVNHSFERIEKLDHPINTNESGEWPSHISRSNSVLWFSSIRKSGIGGDDIYISHKSKGSWQEPILLNDSINSKFYEDSAFITADSSHFFFSSGKPFREINGMSNIYVSKNKAKP
ncbi:hypothetical protein J0X14_11940 [Muricauda sp. CAU 1633]|uniref:hypothetical protein n=1 Tax=Allomuricauda sp. CAU 1633 TaxID=2816036 RepID=UPI001A90BE50|nr:hypothetical protein [Muricauda sp. CAU 1633]MBO0323009.1 hypothetical protein [Muricauda sp. CAU 1633]